MDIAGFSNAGYVPVVSSWVTGKRSLLKPDVLVHRSVSQAVFGQMLSQNAIGNAMRGGDSFHSVQAKGVRFRGGTPPLAMPKEIQEAMDSFARAFKATEDATYGTEDYHRLWDESFNQGRDMQKSLKTWATTLAPNLETNAAGETQPGEHSMESDAEGTATEAEKEARKVRNQAYKLAQTHARTLSKNYNLENEDTFVNHFLQPSSKKTKENKARLADIDRRLERVNKVLNATAFQQNGYNDFIGAIHEILMVDSLMAEETRKRSNAQVFSSKRQPSLSRRSSTSGRPVLLEELMTNLKDAQKNQGKYTLTELKTLLTNAYIQLKSRRFNKSANAEVRSLRSRRSDSSFQDGEKTPSEGVHTPSRKRAATFREPKLPPLPGLQTSHSVLGIGGLGDMLSTPTPNIVEWLTDDDPPYAAGGRTSGALSPTGDISLLLSGMEDRPTSSGLMMPPLTIKRSRDRESDESTQSLIEWLENMIVTEQGKEPQDSQQIKRMERTLKKLRNKLV